LLGTQPIYGLMRLFSIPAFFYSKLNEHKIQNAPFHQNQQSEFELHHIGIVLSPFSDRLLLTSPQGASSIASVHHCMDCTLGWGNRYKQVNVNGLYMYGSTPQVWGVRTIEDLQWRHRRTSTILEVFFSRRAGRFNGNNVRKQPKIGHLSGPIEKFQCI
jgi:hypothetical protein